MSGEGGPLMMEGFDMYGPEHQDRPSQWVSAPPYHSLRAGYALPKRSWWKRLFSRRPPGTLYLSFHYKDDEWKVAEATVKYPEGVESVDLSYRFFLNDKQVIDFEPHDQIWMG